MPELIQQPTIIQAAGNKPKRIEEFIGRVNTRTHAVSIARMQSPPGWEEPGQRPEFDEYTVVVKGMLRVTTPGRPFLLIPENGSVTALQAVKGPNTLQSVCRRFLRKR